MFWNASIPLDRTLMEPTAIRRLIEIDGMSGEVSVSAVSAALGRVSGVRTESVEVGQATIGCTYPAAFGSACAAIHYAGFSAREGKSPAPPPSRAPLPAQVT